MTTQIYGQSDDLIEFEGDVSGEVGFYSPDGDGVLVFCSDGTMLKIKYGKADMGVWDVELIHPGDLFDRIVPCVDEDADRYSDTAHFVGGLKWAYAAKRWERVR